MSRRFFFGDGAEGTSVEVEPAPGERFRVRVGGREHDVQVLARGGSTVVTVAGRVFELYRGRNGELVTTAGRRTLVAATRPSAVSNREGANRESGGPLRAPMPGRVVKVLVAEGDAVSAGAGVVVVEAMKMENELCAARDGVVKRVHVRTGDAVERDAVMLELE